MKAVAGSYVWMSQFPNPSALFCNACVFTAYFNSNSERILSALKDVRYRISGLRRAVAHAVGVEDRRFIICNAEFCMCQWFYRTLLTFDSPNPFL